MRTLTNLTVFVQARIRLDCGVTLIKPV